MILGIDHIAINTRNINIYEKILLNDSYKCLFKDEIFNNGNKKVFLKEYSEYHSIAYYESLNNYFPIELTEHGNDILKKETPISSEHNSINIKVEDIDDEKSLWAELLGLDKPKSNNILFNSLLPKRDFHLNFIQVKKNISYTLDTVGCTCIALLTNNLDKTILSMNSNESTKFVGPWISEVNNRKLKIAMFKTIGGIIVELIQVERKP